LSGHDHDGGLPRPWTMWRVAAVVLMVLAAVGCTTDRSRTQSLTATTRTAGVPAATSNRPIDWLVPLR